MNRQQTFSLRQRKYAATKLALLNAALDKLKEKAWDKIAVRELCEIVQVSEATFFNYFPSKTDLLVYFVQLWTIEEGWYVQRALEGGSALAAVEALFEFNVQRHAENPEVMAEIIAWQARQKGELPLSEVTAVERITAFPNREGIEGLPVESLGSILPELIARAVEQGELPEETDIQTVATALAAIFFGIPIVQRSMEEISLTVMYRRQLDFILNRPPVTIPSRPISGSIPDKGEAFPWS
jgi:AcrR family transcriptional regulator